MCCTVLSVDVFKFFKFSLFAVEELYDGHARDVFLEKGVQVSHGIADIVEGHLDFFLEYIGRDDQQGEGTQADQGQFPVNVEHHA